MQPLKGLENAFGILLVKSDAVILNIDLTSPSIVFCMDLDSRTFVTSVFQSIADEILKEVPHLIFVGFNGWHAINLDRAARFLEVLFEQVGCFPNDLTKVNFLERFRPRSYSRESEQVMQKLACNTMS